MNTQKRLAKFIFGLLCAVLSAALIGCWAKPSSAKECKPILLLGAKQYQIQSIKTSSDKNIEIPGNKPEIAYWIDETKTNYVFGLSPTDNNLSLETALKAEDQATVTLENCNSTKFSLTSSQPGVPDNSALLDQSVSGITIFVQSPSTQGFVIKGELAQETITTFNTPDTTGIQAEISLLETTTSADGKTIRVGISILNTGQSSITLSSGDVSLTAENSAPTAPEKFEPNLPKEIKPGATDTFYFTFLRPASKTATLKILNVEFDLDGN